MLLFTFSGTAVLLGLGGLCLAVGLTVFLLRGTLRRQKPGQAKNAAFSFTSPVHRLSLCVAIGAAILCLNWTQYSPERMVYGEMEVFDDLIEVDVPITTTPPPPPPPPPPPVIEAVAEPDVEPIKFIDQTVDDNDVVLAPPPAIAPAAAPVPPAPPPPHVPVVEEPLLIFAERMPVFGQECFELPDTERKTCSDGQLLRFVQSRVNYPGLARENGIEGTVVVSFIVERDGTISSVTSVRGVGGGCTEAALKAVNAINKEGQIFLPGRQGGRNVRVKFNLPVKFKLE